MDASGTDVDMDQNDKERGSEKIPKWVSAFFAARKGLGPSKCKCPVDICSAGRAPPTHYKLFPKGNNLQRVPSGVRQTKFGNTRTKLHPECAKSLPM